VRANQRSAGFKALNRVLKIAVSDGGGTDNQRAIGNSLGNGLEFLRVGKNVSRGAHGRAGAFKGYVIGIYDAEVKESEVAHGAGGRADVQRIARVDEDDSQTVKFRGHRQGGFILREDANTAGAKARSIESLYAALKRRSSTKRLFLRSKPIAAGWISRRYKCKKIVKGLPIR
jgi:hypothetical protein